MVDKLIVYTDQSRGIDVVKNLKIYSNNSRGVLYGINRLYYPKCTIWGSLYAGSTEEELLSIAQEFYTMYYYYPLKLDVLELPLAAKICLEFAALEGKKKLLNKIQKVVGEPLKGIALLEKFNKLGTLGIYKLLLELVEHYYHFSTPEKANWVLEYYREYSR